MKKKDYFEISLEMLKEKKIFPFHLHVFNPLNKQYSSYLLANNPLTQKKREFLEYIIKNGGKLAVAFGQKSTFLEETETKEEEVPSLKDAEPHPLEKARKMYQKILEDKDKINGPFIFQEEMNKAVEAENFAIIIERTHDEIMTLPVNLSSTVSLAVHLTDLLMTEDNYINRVVAVAYQLAKVSDMRDEEILGDLVCAAFLHHVGISQLDIAVSRKAFYAIPDEFRKEYKKHQGLAHHLIKKSGVELSKRCLDTILEHHERNDGSGYPFQKMGNKITPLALLLGAVSHIFEYATGKIDGNTRSIKSVLSSLKNKTFTPGLEFEFGDTIYNNLI